VLRGELAVETPGEASLTAGPGDTVGIYEALAGVPAGAKVTVVKGGTLLRVDRRDLFDLLADNIDLLQGLFSALLQQEAKRKEVAAT
jgi:CRP-like cAMP-binding protein